MREEGIDEGRVREMLARTKEWSSRHHPRLAGSDGCLRAAGDLAEALGKFCDRAGVENFTLFPASFFLLPRIFAAAYAAAALGLFLGRAAVPAAAVLLALVLAYAVSQFVFFDPLFDRFFPRRPGSNAAGILEPRGEVRCRIIVSGHHDSAPVCRFLERSPHLYALRVVPAMAIYVLAAAGTAFFSLAGGSGPAFAAFRLAVLAGLFFVAPLFWYYRRDASPGAGDNLLSSAALVDLAEFFRGGPERALAHTRLVFLSFDGEEIGQRGARAFAQEHRAELGAGDTLVLNIDSLYRLEDLAVLESDRNGTLRLSARLADEVAGAAARLGHRIRRIRFPFGGGGTDAAPFARIGVEAASIIGLSTRMNRKGVVYHTSRDTVDRIEPEAVAAGLNTVIRVIQDADRAVSADPGVTRAGGG